jgi:hypothetical protein
MVLVDYGVDEEENSRFMQVNRDRDYNTELYKTNSPVMKPL